MGPTAIVLFLLVSAALVTAKEYVLEDLIAEEDSQDNRRVIHNIGNDDDDQSKGSKKVLRQSRVEDTIRIVQEPITGPGYKQEQSQSSTVKDKGGGTKDEDDEDKKTLSQQVADGKYGLIQTEIFNNDPDRPGIISYEVNPEVPKDNVNNLGGLKPEEIWLAENHLLVLTGGGFKDKNHNQIIWPPIDNYIAPSRQVKIPPNPKVPPPFPVQLKPGGPLEFIKNENGTGGPPPFFPPINGGPLSPPTNASFPYPPAVFNQGNFTLGNGPFLPPPFPFLPQPPNGSYFLPPPGFLPPIPPVAAFLPPPGNLTDQFDEDDPSIYYPPPYDFYYPKDNSSLVPPGPLVPGIVLPPPPDFFAPFKNITASKSRRPGTRPHLKSKTPNRKTTKTKNVQRITSTEEPYHGVTIRPNIGKINLITTPPTAFYTTKIPPVTTEIYTRRPSIKTTTDNLINEITPPTIVHTLPPNAIVKGWVPIPAPHPYYITGSRKPYQKSVTSTLPPDYNSVTPSEDQGYIYNTPNRNVAVNSWLRPNKTKVYDEQYYRAITGSPKQDYYYDDYYSGRGQYYSSTESPLGYEEPTQQKSIYYPSRTPVNLQPDDKEKSLKTYYFYEEPHISQAKLTDTENIPHPTASPQQKHKADPLTITEEEYVNTAIKQSPQGQFKSSPLDYFYHQDSYINSVSQKSSTESSLQFYFVPEENKDYVDYPYPPAGVSTPRTKTSTKTPVYEFSFAIPGYGIPAHTNIQQQKPEQLYQVTHKPFEEHLYTTPTPSTTPISPYKNSNQAENHYITTKKPHSQYYSTRKPPGKGSFQTENPYHAFFTHHDADLIDDITKKYFTTFGQKLNKDSIRGDGLTTPLPHAEDVTQRPHYPRTSPRPQYYESDRPRIKYPQNSFPYGIPQYYAISSPSPLRNYPSKSPYSRPVYSEFYDQRPHPSLVSTQKPISLGSDVLVNFKEPLPPLNPDAEFIDPSNPAIAKPDQSFISYRLPGNGGGHFFFLTPQVIQQNDQYADYIYNSEQTGPFYKRNIQRSQTQRRRPAHSRTL